MSASIDPIELLHPSPDVAERKLEILSDLSQQKAADPPSAAREAMAMVTAGIDFMRVNAGVNGAQRVLDLASAELGRLVVRDQDAALIHSRRAAEEVARQARRTGP